MTPCTKIKRSRRGEERRGEEWCKIHTNQKQVETVLGCTLSSFGTRDAHQTARDDAPLTSWNATVARVVVWRCAKGKGRGLFLILSILVLTDRVLHVSRITDRHSVVRCAGEGTTTIQNFWCDFLADDSNVCIAL